MKNDINFDFEHNFSLERGKARYGAVRNEGFDESKHPRADDGKFGSGGGGAKEEKSAKKGKEETAEELREKAEKSEDGNNPHKAEAQKEKARKLEKEKKPAEKKSKEKASKPGASISPATAQKFLKEIKDKGVGFWQPGKDRSEAYIFVRTASGNDPQAWRNAGIIEKAFGSLVRESAKGDPQSGCLVIKIRNPYHKGGA